jgi:hypothetical protein
MQNDPNDFLKEKLEIYKPDTSKFHLIIDQLKRLLVPWGNGLCNDLVIMGSIKHGTAIRKGKKEDLDLMLSMKSDVPYTVEELYNSLHKFLKSKEFKVELRNISLRIEVNGVSVDLVPAIKHPGSDMHTVWSRREAKELNSNVELHNDIIQKSQRQDEIKLLKVMCYENNVSIDGIYLAFSVIEALKGKSSDLSSNLLTVMKYLSTKWINQKFADPSRPSDLVSDNNTKEEKEIIVKKMKKLLSYNSWNECFNE